MNRCLVKYFSAVGKTGLSCLQILVCLILIGGKTSFAQNISPLDQKIPPSHLQHDFHVLCTLLEENHPSLYAYVSNEEWKHLKQQIASELHQAKTWREFYRLLSGLVAKIRCEHTVLRVSEKVYEYLIHESSGLFPIDVRIVGDTVLMYQNLHEYMPPTKTILLTIDGVAVSTILEEFSRYISHDGLNETSKQYALENYFPFFYAVLKNEQDSFRVVWKDLATNRTGETTLQGMPYHTLQRRKLQWYASPTTFSSARPHFFALKLRDFERRRNWARFFRYLKKIRIDKLLIDLRDNKGGLSEEAKNLLQYLIPEKITFPYVFLTKTKEITFDSLIEGSVAQKKRSLRYIHQTPLLKDSLVVFASLKKIAPSRHVFRGKIAVLVNANTSSAAVQLAASLHHYQRACFFGEETGGRYSGGNGGVIFSITLPYSSIKLQLPMLRYYNQVANRFPDRGLPPDFPLYRTIDNLLSKQDEVQQKAIEWLLND